MTDKPRRRIVLPKKSKQDTDVVVVPTLNSLMNDALSIVGAELAQYRSKTSRGVTLDLKEARVVTGYLDALTKASKESREAARAEDLADLSNEELLQLATQLTKSNMLPKDDKAVKAAKANLDSPHDTNDVPGADKAAKE